MVTIGFHCENNTVESKQMITQSSFLGWTIPFIGHIPLARQNITLYNSFLLFVCLFVFAVYDSIWKYRSTIGQLLKYLSKAPFLREMGQHDSGNGAGMAALMLFYGLTISSRVEHIRFSQDHIWSCQAKKEHINADREKHASLTAWEWNNAACEWVFTGMKRKWRRHREKELSNRISVYCGFEGEPF